MSQTIKKRARWVLPITSPPIRDAEVIIAENRIVGINPVAEEPWDSPQDDAPARRILLPGLVNAHTHLEFSDLEQPLGQSRMPFANWIEKVIQSRIDLVRSEHGGEKKLRAIRAGIDESHQWGVSLIGEISSGPWPESPDTSQTAALHQKGPCVLPFFEQLGAVAAQAEDRFLALRKHLNERTRGTDCGLSPHAPYSVSPDLYHQILKLTEHVSDQQRQLAMHLAESPEELEYASQGTGAFASLFERLKIPSQFEAKLQIEECLDGLLRFQNSLIIHGNYLSSFQILRLKDATTNPTVVFCPRTHAYFGHAEYPLRKLLASGVNVAVGTDSRASSPDLDLLAELIAIRQAFPDISANEILNLGTINGARALRQSHRFGSLEIGRTAKILCLEFASPIEGDPYEAILSQDIVRRSWVD